MRKLQRVATVCAAGLGVALAVSISAVYLFAIALLIVYALERPAFKKTPLDIPIIIFVTWGLLTALFRQSTSFGGAISYQCVLLLYLLTAHALSTDSLERMVKWFVIASVVMGAYGFLQYISGVIVDPQNLTYRMPEWMKTWPEPIIKFLSSRNERAVGTRSHPLTFAEGLVPAFFVAFFAAVQFILKKESPKKIALTALACMVIGLGVLGAEGRAVWIGIFAGLLLTTAMLPRRLGLAVAAGLFVLVLAGLTLSPGLRGRALSAISSSAGTVGDQESKIIRQKIWWKTWAGIQDKPLIGVGLRGTRLKVDAEGIYFNRTWTETHNTYLQITHEQGIVGLGIFLWILIAALQLMHSANPPEKWIFMATWLTFLIAGLTESWTKDREVAMIFWTFLGTALSWRRKPKENYG